MLLGVRHAIEYALLRTFLFTVDHLSLSRAERLVTRLADLAYTLGRHRRHTAVDNVLRSGIAESRAQAENIARNSFRHFGILILEALRSENAFNENNWRDRVTVSIPPGTMDLLTDPGQGIILVSAHIGNWEVAAQLLSYLKPVAGITSKMNNPYTDRLMQKRKPRNNFRLIPKRNTDMGRFMKILKSGEILALLADQYARKGGMMIDCFGTPASMHRSPALLHLVTKAPIIFGYCLRNRPMQYSLTALDPIIHKPTGDREEDVRTILTLLNSETEKVIRLAPDQYLWAHRRWRHVGPAPK